MSELVTARHKLTGDIIDGIRAEAVDVRGGFFESVTPDTKGTKTSRAKREHVETPVADEAAPTNEPDPATGAPNPPKE